LKNNIKNGKIKNSSLVTKLLLSFILFAIGIFVILWIMQVVFLQTYYSIMKKGEIIKISNNIVREKVDKDFLYELTSYAYKNNVTIYMADKNGKLIYDSTIIEETDLYNQTMKIPLLLSWDKLIDELNDSDEEILKYTYKIDRFKTEMFVCARKFNDNVLILISSIDPIDATTNVLSNQLMYCTVISLIISVILSIVISRRIAKPIVVIDNQAKELAKGNYDIKFKRAGYLELDNLVDTLNYATQELRKTDNLRKELIANVSHDLRTPLTMIKAYSEMIRDMYIEDKDKTIESLNTIIDETDRMTNLVSDMLDLSKIENNNMVLNIKSINIYEITKSIIDNFKLVDENKDLIININSETEVFVNCDKSKITQVIYNLISNAINYSGDNKEIKIDINQNKAKVKFMVKDNGQGISKDDLPYIWDRYYKANKKYSRTSQGSGLGLAIVKNILELHKAKYGVESQEGIGTTFWFELDK